LGNYNKIFLLLFIFYIMPFIDRDFINDLTQRVDIVDLINRRVPLKKAGKDYKACCPFHNEKTPSFSVAPDKQMYYCFGCAEGGNALDFVMKFDHLDFTEAVETVASESGISVVYDQEAKPVDTRIKRYQDLMQKVNEFYKYQLRHSPAKDKVTSYAYKRKISGQIAMRFELGFAPPGWSNLFDHFKQDENDIKDLEKMGLLVAKKGKEGEYYDRFRDRLMFPIHNARGDVIAFGGRVLSSEDNPKYLNSPETPLFSKSNELYGLQHCRKYSRSIDYILVVEGYMDVVALHQGDITRTVATLGTATTPQHLQKLSRTTNTIIFCFDGDRAGRAAAWKALQIALPVIKAGLVIKFLFLPDGEDPDTLVKKESTKAFEARIKNAHTLSKFLFDHVKAEVDFDTIEGKTLFLEKVSVLVNQVNYEIYQQQLIKGIAQVLGQSIDQVQTIFQQQAAQPRATPPVIDDEPPISEFTGFTDDDPVSQPASTQSSAVKTHMSRMIRLLLNYPVLADDTVETRVRQLNKTNKKFEVLLELVHSSQMGEDEDISQEELIKPFKNKIKTYNRLKQLCTLEVPLSEKAAREEFLDALLKVEDIQKKAESLLIEDEEEYAKNLKARKGKKS